MLRNGPRDHLATDCGAVILSTKPRTWNWVVIASPSGGRPRLLLASATWLILTSFYSATILQEDVLILLHTRNSRHAKRKPDR